jgi:hypothetical protein
MLTRSIPINPTYNETTNRPWAIFGRFFLSAVIAIQKDNKNSGNSDRKYSNLDTLEMTTIRKNYVLLCKP